MPSEKIATWVFDDLPPSGARRGGDPSALVFRPTLETFVREVIQNANDQALERPRVRFRLRELDGERLRSFLEALDWEGLRPHLEAAAKVQRRKTLRSALDDLEGSRRMLVLSVEDFNTVGLTGDEFEGTSHFRALCKDTLFSHKQSNSAGGSYGLGKSVLWAFSGLSTVLFNSVLSEPPPNRSSPRLIGRVELPSHPVGKAWSMGPGWLGKKTQGPGGARAESVWSVWAGQLARELEMARDQSNPGTSILIVGFREPAGDEEHSIPDLLERIRRATLVNFWPAMRMERQLAVEVGDGSKLEVDALEELAPFVSCFDQLDSEQTLLENPGDVVVRELPIDIPAQRDGAPAVQGWVRLAVRLGSENGSRVRVGQVAMFRGPGMVVRYWDRSNLATAARPFHAVLACGQARDPDRDTDEDRAVEHFLQMAEPPGHDQWESTSGLKEEYQRGYAKALQQLETRITETLREILSQGARAEARGPERLQKLFPIGRKGGREAEPAAFHFSDLEAFLEGDRWRFGGVVRPVRRGKAWRANLRLREVGDAGAPLSELPILELEAEGAEAGLVDGLGVIRAAARTGAVRFHGSSSPLDGHSFGGELGMEITGEWERKK